MWVINEKKKIFFTLSPFWVRYVLRKAVLIIIILNIKIKLVWCYSSVVVEVKEDFCNHSHK